MTDPVLHNRYLIDKRYEEYTHKADMRFLEDMEDTISCAVTDCLTAEGAEQSIFEVALDCGGDELDSFSAWKLICKVAAGKEGMHEARDFINRLCVEYAYHMVENSHQDDRRAKRWLDVAKSVSVLKTRSEK